MNQDPIISVYKKFIYVVIVVVTVISILISVLVLNPFYANLLVEDDTKFYLYGEGLKSQIKTKIIDYKHIANQISTRTQAKNILIDYNNNAVRFEDANKTLHTIFNDALKNSSIQGIMRLDDEDKVLVRVGTTREIVDFKNNHTSDVVEYFIDSGVLYLSITTPLYDNNLYIGSDIVTFTTDEIRKIIDQNKTFSTIGIQFLDGKNNTLLSTSPNLLLNTDTIENSYSLLEGAYVLKTTVAQSQLHQSSYKKIREIIFTILIILLVSLVGIYFISKKLLGLVEVEIAQKKELQVIKAETAKFATIGYILFAIEHEWRKPLNYLSALSAKFQHKFHQNTQMNEKEFHDFLIVVDNTVSDMSQTMTDFKQIYLPSYQKESIEIGGLIDQTVQYFKKNKNTKKIKIEYAIQNDKIYTYPYAWRYIVLNLLQNSFEKFSETNRDLLHIHIGFEGKIFTFEDDAGGVEDISQILQTFYTTKKHNSGIGLLIVKSLVEDSLGGKIDFSPIDNGLKISITHEEKRA